MKKKDTKILLVDDEPDILEIIGYNLSTEGYRVLTAENGVEAIVQAKKHRPHLIILDVMMPKMDGIEACEKIRAIPDLNETVITFLTARGEDYSQVAGFEAGADDYITKPIKPTQLEKGLQKWLMRQGEEHPENPSITKAEPQSSTHESVAPQATQAGPVSDRIETEWLHRLKGKDDPQPLIQLIQEALDRVTRVEEAVVQEDLETLAEAAQGLTQIC